jgi:WD40 repeat protein
MIEAEENTGAGTSSSACPDTAERGRGRPRPASSTLCLLASLSVSSAVAQEKITYQDNVLPLIEANCSKCHNPDKKKADLDLTSFQGALKGSGSGPIVLSSNPDGSKLWKALNHSEEPFMPPNRPKLGDKELETFKKWIAGGLLENATGKSIAAASSGVDLTLKPEALGKPEGPPPMPQELPLETVVHTPRGTAITGLAASPWAPFIAVAGQKEVLLFHSDTLELLGILPFAEGQPVDLKFSRSGKLLLASGGRAAKSGRVVVWDVVTGEHLMTLGDEYDTVLTADIRPDQSQVALGSPSRLVKVISLKNGEVQHKIKKHTDWVMAVAFSPNGQMLASADRNGSISIWDPDSAQELFTFAGHKSAVTALSWRPDSKLLASSSEDGTVKLWDLKEGKRVKSWTANSSGSLCVNYSPDGQLVTCGRDNSVTIWDGNGGKGRHCEFFGNIPIRAVFSSDSQRVVATDFEGRIGVWTVADQKRVGEINPDPLLLPDQIAAAQKKADDLQLKVSAAATNIAAAEVEVAKATAALEEAKKNLESAHAEQTARQSEVAKLSEQLTNAPTDLPAKLAASSAAWNEASTKVTNINATVEARTKDVETAKGKLAAAKAQSPDAELATAKAALNKLQAAQVLTSVYRVREAITLKRREHERAAATLDANLQAQQKAEKELAVAKEAASKAEAELKSAQAEVSTNKPATDRLAAELKAEQARLDALLNQYRSAGTNATALAKGTGP